VIFSKTHLVTLLLLQIILWGDAVAKLCKEQLEQKFKKIKETGKYL
jgi:hypothetical protein